MSYFPPYGMKKIDPDALAQVCKIYDVIPGGGNRVRRSNYNTANGQTGSAIAGFSLGTGVGLPNNILLLGMGLAASLDLSGVVPTNVGVISQVIPVIPNATQNEAYGAMGNAMDRYCVAAARLDLESLTAYEDLSDTPLLLPAGSTIDVQFIVSTGGATAWNLFQYFYFDFVTVIPT